MYDFMLENGCLQFRQNVSGRNWRGSSLTSKCIMRTWCWSRLDLPSRTPETLIDKVNATIITLMMFLPPAAVRGGRKHHKGYLSLNILSLWRLRLQEEEFHVTDCRDPFTRNCTQNDRAAVRGSVTPELYRGFPRFLEPFSFVPYWSLDIIKKPARRSCIYRYAELAGGF